MVPRILIICLIVMTSNSVVSQNSLLLNVGHEWNRYDSQRPGEWHRGTSFNISWHRDFTSRLSMRLNTKFKYFQYRFPQGSTIDVDVDALFTEDGLLTQSFSNEIPSYRSSFRYTETVSFHNSLSLSELEDKQDIQYFMALRESYTGFYTSITPIFTPIIFKKSRLHIGVDIGFSLFLFTPDVSFVRRILNREIITRDRNIPLETLNELSTQQIGVHEKVPEFSVQGVLEYGYYFSEIFSFHIGYYSGLQKNSIRSSTLSGIRIGIGYQL